MKPMYSFSISRADRISMVVFIFFLLTWELVKLFMPIPMTQKHLSVDHASQLTLRAEEKLKPQQENKTMRERSIIPSGPKPDESQPPPAFMPVKIMEATTKELIAIGFEPYTARNISKYKDAGGILADKEAVLRIYGMDTVQWNKVADYILFPDQSAVSESKQPYDPNRFLPKRIIDLNTAEVTDLDSLPGIGPVFAERIVQYRNRLGGFYTVRQIESCYGIPPETIEKILPLVAIVTPMTPKNVRDINWSTYNHPYLEYKFRPMIISYQKNHGPLQTVSDLRNVFPPDTGWCDKLLPYLTFDEPE